MSDTSSSHSSPDNTPNNDLSQKMHHNNNSTNTNHLGMMSNNPYFPFNSNTALGGSNAMNMMNMGMGVNSTATDMLAHNAHNNTGNTMLNPALFANAGGNNNNTSNINTTGNPGTNPIMGMLPPQSMPVPMMPNMMQSLMMNPMMMNMMAAMICQQNPAMLQAMLLSSMSNQQQQQQQQQQFNLQNTGNNNANLLQQQQAFQVAQAQAVAQQQQQQLLYQQQLQMQLALQQQQQAQAAAVAAMAANNGNNTSPLPLGLNHANNNHGFVAPLLPSISNLTNNTQNSGTIAATTTAVKVAPAHHDGGPASKQARIKTEASSSSSNSNNNNNNIDGVASLLLAIGGNSNVGEKVSESDPSAQHLEDEDGDELDQDDGDMSEGEDEVPDGVHTVRLLAPLITGNKRRRGVPSNSTLLKVSFYAWDGLLIEHVKVSVTDCNPLPTMVDWVEQFKGLEIVTEYEYRIFQKLAHDPDLQSTASHLKRYALSVNKKNDAFYKRDFGWNYLKEQLKYGRTQMLCTIYWAAYVIYFSNASSVQSLLYTREQFEFHYVTHNPVDGTKTTHALFNNVDELEMQRLLQFRNLMMAAFHVVPAHRNEVLLLKIAAALERSGRKYQISSSGQMIATTRRRLIYRREASLWTAARSAESKAKNAVARQQQREQKQRDQLLAAEIALQLQAATTTNNTNSANNAASSSSSSMAAGDGKPSSSS